MHENNVCIKFCTLEVRRVNPIRTFAVLCDWAGRICQLGPPKFNWFKRRTCMPRIKWFVSAHEKYVWTGPNFPYLSSQHLRRRFFDFWIPLLEVRSMKIIINVVTWNYSPEKVSISRVQRDASGWAAGRHIFGLWSKLRAVTETVNGEPQCQVS